MSKLKYILLIILVGLLFSSFNKQTYSYILNPTEDSSYLNYDKDLESLLDKKFDKAKISILTEKLKYKLTVFYEGKEIKSYPIILGSNPVDNKIKEGDGCTPEGKFKIKNHYSHKKWSKFIWFSYPNGDDWKRYGSAKSQGLLKMSDSIGSNLGIHGVPENQDSLIDNKINWTDGSISLKNKDINEIYEIIKDGISLEIIK